MQYVRLPNREISLEPAFIRHGSGRMIVPEYVRKSVLFIGIKKSGVFQPRATAFFVDFVQETFAFRYLVTAEHVISSLVTKGHELWVRSNLKNGQPLEDRLSPDWTFHPNNETAPTDVAVCHVLTHPDEDIDPMPLGATKNNIAATAGIIAENNIGVGDEVAIVGLFRSHAGRQANIPIVRTGNIAMLKGEPVFTKYCGYTEAHLIEARSISGLSGSPVFINMPPMKIVGNRSVLTKGKQLYLLGLMHGHFDIPSLTEDVVSDDDTSGSNGIHTGIGVVIPVEKIIETIDHPDLVNGRAEAIADHKKVAGATPDVVADAVPSSTDDANPNHLEDFTRLVDAAARKRPQGD